MDGESVPEGGAAAEKARSISSNPKLWYYFRKKLRVLFLPLISTPYNIIFQTHLTHTAVVKENNTTVSVKALHVLECQN